MNTDNPTPKREKLSPETRAALDRGLAQSAVGEVVDLGSFAEYANTPTDEEPSEDGWYAYDGGRQTMIFRLTRGQWYVITDSGQCDPCEWGYIEQALSTWNLVPLDLVPFDLAAREQALREEIAKGIEADLACNGNLMTPSERKGQRWAARIARGGVRIADSEVPELALREEIKKLRLERGEWMARYEALREEIAGEIEAVTIGAGGVEWAMVRRVALRDAARIARGGGLR